MEHDLKPASDEALMEAVEQKSIDAFEELYDRHHSTALAVAYHVLGDRQLAEDAVQETFLAVWGQARSFRPGLGMARSWLLSIVRHRAIDMTRRRSFSKERLSLDERAFQPHPDVWQQVSRKLDGQRVRQALEALPSEQKEAILLAFFGGYTYQEVAERLAVPLGTVKGRMRLAMEKLRGLLLDVGEGGAH
jgi:RNA polymerase sigma-70 factor (ECF subfamily)